MKESGGILKKWNPRMKNEKPEAEASSGNSVPEGEQNTAVRKAADVIKILCLAFWRLRGIFMAVPVVFAALRLAAYNSEHLPLLVGINLRSTGEFAYTISRQSAVTWPLFITAGCLAMMLLSRKNLYPWLISIFSLAIPVLLLITNMYPA